MWSRRAPLYRTLASLSRITLLHQLQQREAMTIAELAEAAGLHHNTAREHLHRLINDGFVTVEAEHRDARGRPRLLYSAAGVADRREGSVRAEKIGKALLRAELVRRMLPAGSATGASSPLRRQLDALDDHLDQTGFDARLAPDGRHMHLHACPFADLVRDHPEVCRVHLGLLRGVLDQAGGPLAAEELHPLAAPDTCTLDLSGTGPAA